MGKKTLLTLLGFIIIGGGGIGLLKLDPFSRQKNQESHLTRIIIPQEIGEDSSSLAERMAYEDSVTTKAAMNKGEIVVAILSQDFDGDTTEEQVVAYRDLSEAESPVYVAYIDYDEQAGGFVRMWTAPTAATQPGTIGIFTQDLLGDHSLCVILTGMNSKDEHTMTVFRQPPEKGRAFAKIAEIRIDGSIVIQETERSQAYHQGIAKDKSFNIAAFAHDTASSNILDQLEITYSFNPVMERYEQTRTTRLPGSQIEQRRLRELLSGGKGIFEDFINDLWYYVSPQGTIDNRQYIYFDPSGKEIVFFGDNIQQVYNWQNSSTTRYGLYISSQNISVTTLRRFLDIELESLDSIRIKVFEDVRLKIVLSGVWDGSYRRADIGSQTTTVQAERTIMPPIDAQYDSTMGRFRFSPSGEYELKSGAAPQKGRYVFFRVNGRELLELRPDEARRPQNNAGTNRLVYRVEVQPGSGGEQSPAAAGNADPGTEALAKNLSLSRVRLGATGIQDLHEGTITLTAVRE